MCIRDRRIPGGVVRSHQLRELAAIARDLTTGYIQITTRNNFQIRLIQPKDCPEVCLLYTSDAADERSSVDLGGRRIIKKNKKEQHRVSRLYKQHKKRKQHVNEIK